MKDKINLLLIGIGAAIIAAYAWKIAGIYLVLAMLIIGGIRYRKHG